MSQSTYPLWIGPILGGLSFTIISAGSIYYMDHKLPETKILARDFVLGAILFLIIMQILPESTSTLIQFIGGLTTFRFFSSPKMSGGAEITLPEAIPLSADPEVKVGVPNF
jgi:uncharacterized membrane protein YhfC